jgi:hypothetical protein
MIDIFLNYFGSLQIAIFDVKQELLKLLAQCVPTKAAREKKRLYSNEYRATIYLL